jgi:hypothetical protein
VPDPLTPARRIQALLNFARYHPVAHHLLQTGLHLVQTKCTTGEIPSALSVLEYSDRDSYRRADYPYDSDKLGLAGYG